ncbi:N-acetylmuramoyl-L-alanine amidase [Serratia plymuthica]|uniref:N-acetylmuramoyl-L-alanine amidase n=1 Tax=Serratia plymuthica TaxID=82996 RepID=A0A2X4UVI5_SERPL|nr:peptidoglycan recognition family protein [Serratia plymuthica]QPS20914.1 N-acetylmuramoyl-L-alanine amidase [Serratia plymuthica]QPS53801.1 N-acetylmuramoyl-L-alanine amidase [Serratia plymuthica]QPS62526.1 N-acetylmuramoyl-L-alanine amidase [Serratia plymuthica]RKS65171.1 N-acetylmuramoyl-L-alanine amidase [Serratia plymuthica]UNK25880.1 N-acetylmuramoyl-L-alanine amidase [Serratia plymuthica]
MLFVDKNGLVDAECIIVKRFSTIERGKLNKVNGIVVHQTGGSTAESSFNSYKNTGANGAHFLIDKDGAIYQTASVFKVTNHVGNIRSRCYMEKTCTPSEISTIKPLLNKYKQLSRLEQKKPYPERYPANFDSLGIEIVGKPTSGEGENAVYEKINDAQNSSLRWLIAELTDTLKVSMTEIFRHPEVSYKVKTEAGTARW